MQVDGLGSCRLNASMADEMHKDMQMWYAGKDAIDRAELSLATIMA